MVCRCFLRFTHSCWRFLLFQEEPWLDDEHSEFLEELKMEMLEEQRREEEEEMNRAAREEEEKVRPTRKHLGLHGV